MSEVKLQERVKPWLYECFGPQISADKTERNHRFLEEALELAQACGCTKSEAKQLLEYVYDRPAGEPEQEVGGVMITLAALCLAWDMDMDDAGDRELDRIWNKIETIRQKQANKPKHSPLPQALNSHARLVEGLEEALKALDAVHEFGKLEDDQMTEGAADRVAGFVDAVRHRTRALIKEHSHDEG